MQFIYSRVSTGKQETANQLSKLKELYPSASVYEETASGAKRRPVLEELVKALKPGDQLIVAALDRLGRKTTEILALIEDLERRGVILKSLREGLDYSTVTGRLVTQILVACAELERGLISARTREALATKRSQGIVGGRRPSFNLAMVERVLLLRSSGLSCRAISSATGVSASRVSELCRKKIDMTASLFSAVHGV